MFRCRSIRQGLLRGHDRKPTLNVIKATLRTNESESTVLLSFKIPYMGSGYAPFAFQSSFGCGRWRFGAEFPSRVFAANHTRPPQLTMSPWLAGKYATLGIIRVSPTFGVSRAQFRTLPATRTRKERISLMSS